MRRGLLTLGATSVALTLFYALSTVSADRATPPNNAAVTVHFDGLQLLCYGNEGRMTSVVLDAIHHSPTLTVTRIVEGKRSVVMTRKGDQLRMPWIIEVEGAARPIERYQAASMYNDPKDWHWVMSLDEVYPGRTFTIREEKPFGKVHFLAGTFHATKLSRLPVRFYAANGDNSQVLPFKRRAAAPAASIDLNPGEALLLRSERELLRFEVKEGVQYEVSLTNLPPPEHAGFDHFLYYYEVIQEPLPRYVPFYVEQAAFAPDPLFCGVVVASATTPYP
ncbi:MAG: hypothetical protein AB1489_33205 [Acidobacteriota bacterium]